MRVFIRLSLFLMPCVILGCQYDPYAGDFTTEQPKKEDVIGVYQFKEQNISQVPIDSLGQKATIVLDSDGSYQANNIPNVFGGANAEFHKYISATGKWKIETVGGVDNGWGHEKSQWGITLTDIDQRLTNIGFMGNKRPYKLIVTFEDPDSGEVMIFEKYD